MEAVNDDDDDDVVQPSQSILSRKRTRRILPEVEAAKETNSMLTVSCLCRISRTGSCMWHVSAYNNVFCCSTDDTGN